MACGACRGWGVREGMKECDEVGVWVCVEVLHPDVLEMIESDIDIMR